MGDKSAERDPGYGEKRLKRSSVWGINMSKEILGVGNYSVYRDHLCRGLSVTGERNCKRQGFCVSREYL